jgi:hypothetical protein
VLRPRLLKSGIGLLLAVTGTGMRQPVGIRECFGQRQQSRTAKMLAPHWNSADLKNTPVPMIDPITRGVRS